MKVEGKYVFYSDNTMNNLHEKLDDLNQCMKLKLHTFRLHECQIYSSLKFQLVFSLGIKNCQLMS